MHKTRSSNSANCSPVESCRPQESHAKQAKWNTSSLARRTQSDDEIPRQHFEHFAPKFLFDKKKIIQELSTIISEDQEKQKNENKTFISFTFNLMHNNNIEWIVLKKWHSLPIEFNKLKSFQRIENSATPMHIQCTMYNVHSCMLMM